MTYEQSVLLTGSQWPSLSDEKKLEVLQTIENHTAFESGRLNCPVIGKFLYTGADGVVLGSYDPNRRVIFVNDSQFSADSKYGKDSEAMITACLHEGRHAYQHQVADGTVIHENQQEAETWKRNLSDDNYISFRENPRAYYNQPVEVDARHFAEEKYAQIVSERQSYDMETPSEHSQREVFERQLSDSTSITQQSASISQSEETSNRISFS